MNYEFYLDFPPSVNNYYVKTQRGLFISQKGRKYRAATAEAINGQLPDVTISDPMLVEVILHVPDNRKRDLDNYMKSMLDAITQAGLWEDDSLIHQLHIYKGQVVKPKGAVFIRISDAGPLIPKGFTDI